MTDGGARWRVRVWGPVVRGVSLSTTGAEPGRPRAGSCCLGGLPPPRPGETSGREQMGVRGEPPGLRAAWVEASRPERWIWARALLSPPACCFSGLAVWSQTPAPPVPGPQVRPRATLHQGGRRGSRPPHWPLSLRGVQSRCPPSRSCRLSVSVRSRRNPSAQESADTLRGASSGQTCHVARQRRERVPSQRPSCYQCEHSPGPRHAEARGACTPSRGHAAFPAHRAPRRHVVAPPFPCEEPLSPCFQSQKFWGLLHPLESLWA